MNATTKQADITSVFTQIKQRVDTFQAKAAADDESAMVVLCWDIGRILTENGAGELDTAELSTKLDAVFSGAVDFSVDNLAGMARFFQTYGDHEVLKTLVDAVSWPKHLAILDRCDNDRAQEFYIRMARKFEWTEEVLIQKIEDFRPPQ